MSDYEGRRNYGYGYDYDEDENRDPGRRYRGRDQEYASGYGSSHYGTGFRSGSSGGYGSGYEGGNTGSRSRDRYTGDRYSSDYDQGQGWQGYGGYTGMTGTTDDRKRMSQSRSAGRYVGRGPQGYQRSDERIKEDVSDRLTWHGDVDASNITVTVSSGEVTLEGQVGDRHQKRTAEDVAEGVYGVNDVHNRLTVDQSLLEQIGEGINNLFNGDNTSNGNTNRQR